jgi:hypothetical protein
MVIRGRCHCGNIAFRLTWEPDPVEIPARACGCSFCARHGAVWTALPTGALDVQVADPVQVSRYQQGTRTAEFHVCVWCGVVPVATCRIDDRVYAVVNVRAFEAVDPSLLRTACLHVDEEQLDARLARRRRNWIANVTWCALPSADG